jgi:hypothetical protein
MSKITRLSFFSIIFVTVFFSLAAPVLADDFTPSLQVSIGALKFNDSQPSGGTVTINWIGQYIKAIYQYGVALAVVLAMVMIMAGGFLWLTSAGSPDRVGKAKEFITAALTGLVLALFSFVLLNTINPDLVNLQGLSISDQPDTTKTSSPTPATPATPDYGCCVKNHLDTGQVECWSGYKESQCPTFSKQNNGTQSQHWEGSSDGTCSGACSTVTLPTSGCCKIQSGGTISCYTNYSQQQCYSYGGTRNISAKTFLEKSDCSYSECQGAIGNPSSKTNVTDYPSLSKVSGADKLTGADPRLLKDADQIISTLNANKELPAGFAITSGLRASDSSSLHSEGLAFDVSWPGITVASADTFISETKAADSNVSILREVTSQEQNTYHATGANIHISLPQYSSKTHTGI